MSIHDAFIYAESVLELYVRIRSFEFETELFKDESVPDGCIGIERRYQFACEGRFHAIGGIVHLAQVIAE